MKLSEFDYVLPKDLIAQRPLARRDMSRLMVVYRDRQRVSHGLFRDILKYLQPQDLLVLNNTRVMPVRLFGHKKDTLGKVDVLLSRRVSEKSYEVLIKPFLKAGQKIIFNHGSLKATMKEGRLIEFNQPISSRLLNRLGCMPLPPYIKRRPDISDNKSYQTIYASSPGAIASPTAGLHFTQGLLKDIKDKGINIGYLTLHVGVGTFKPVKCEEIKSHLLEPEEFLIPQQTLKLLGSTKEKGKRVFAVGTTTTRVLESVADINSQKPEARSGSTGLFIYPGYKFKTVDCLLTNFHLPKTTLFMLACAFAGRDLMMQAYQEAIKEKYRFYSYGDAMLIL